MAAPRTGPCAPWVQSSDLLLMPLVQQALAEIASNEGDISLSEEDVNRLAASATVAATESLYKLSGRQFTGLCGPVTIRPVARPVDVDTRATINRAWSYGAIGSSSMWTGGEPGAFNQFGEQYPPIIEITTTPVREIVQVKIDGTVIPPIEYELRDFKQLVRIRPTASYTPTARWGWPTSQIEDLPDTEVGTFSITYMYGADPGEMGRVACLKLAEALLLPQLGDSTHYPERVTNIVRQGVSVQVASVIDVIKMGGSGIYEVDFFILSVNPNRGRRQAVAFSPDRPPNRRQANPSLPS